LQLHISTHDKCSSSRFGVPSLSASLGFGAPSPLDEATPWSLDPDITQCLKRLTKRDVNTKIKALQALISLIADSTPDACTLLLPGWLFVFKRLVHDNNRTIRLTTLQVLAAIVKQAGRKVAPHLKELIGPWWLSMSDPFPEAASQAAASFHV
jgi:E3 ubiquitin-protein ligase listerin